MKNNKLLAEYLGFKTNFGHDLVQDKKDQMYRTYYTPAYNFPLWDPDFNWNQLMMVVEKIEEENGVVEFNIEGSDANIAYQDGEDRMWIIRSGKTKIEAVYNACVEYIKQ